MVQELDVIDVETARELRGRGREPWLRRVGLLLVVVVPVVAILNVFGQRSHTATTDTPTASMSLEAPSDIRGGLLFGATMTVVAHTAVRDASLVLTHGWADGITMNTIEPSPVWEDSHHGDLVFGIGSLSPNETYVLHMQFQVNPTSIGGRVQDVELRSGARPVLVVSHHVTVWP